MPEPNPPHRRNVKIIVLSDYVRLLFLYKHGSHPLYQICSFCYIAHKSLHDAIDACRDLPLRFDVEFRPFTLMCSASLYTSDASKGFSRSAYLCKKFGKEQAEAKWKAATDMAQKAGLKMYASISFPGSFHLTLVLRADDGIVCRSTQAHRLAVKAYQVGGQAMQHHLVSLLFDACFAKCEDISNNTFLADAAVKVGLMNRDRALEFLNSTEALDCVEKMIDAARASGVNGVPFIIIDGKWALNGVQSKDCYIQIFRKLAQSNLSSPVTTLSKTCNDCKDPIIAPALPVQ
ncbi:thioredoxin-like protein [Chiua virens]|nr:thioredoxin-like protein [Chiua virens]